MKKGKLAFVVQRYGNEVNGGAEKLCMQVAERISRRHEVDVLTTCAVDYMTWKDWYPPGEQYIDGVRVIRFPVDRPRDVRRFDAMSSVIFSSKNDKKDELEWMRLQGPYSTRLLDYVRANRDAYDFYFFFTYLYATTYFGLPLVKDKAILVPAAHDEPSIGLGIFREVFNSPQAIIYNTLEEKSFVESLFDNGHILSDIVGVGVDIPPDASASRFRAKYGVRGDFIIYVGRIDKAKGCDILFDYFKRYREETGSGLQLLLCGKEVMKVPDIPGVRRLGFVSDGEKLDAMTASDLLVQPSRYESLSMVMLEAWACGRPSLVNGECAVLKAQCRRSNGSLWFESYEEFRAGLDLLIKDKELSFRLGRNGREFVKKFYGWPAVIEKYDGLMDALSTRYDTVTFRACRPGVASAAHATPSLTGHNVRV